MFKYAVMSNYAILKGALELECVVDTLEEAIVYIENKYRHVSLQYTFVSDIAFGIGTYDGEKWNISIRPVKYLSDVKRARVV